MKNAALSLIGILHQHLGPILKAVVMSAIQDNSIRSHVEKKIDANPHDPSAMANPKRKCLLFKEGDENEGGGTAGMGINIPKIDLMAELPSDILTDMVCKIAYPPHFFSWTKSKQSFPRIGSKRKQGILEEEESGPGGC